MECKHNVTKNIFIGAFIEDFYQPHVTYGILLNRVILFSPLIQKWGVTVSKPSTNDFNNLSTFVS